MFFLFRAAVLACVVCAAAAGAAAEGLPRTHLKILGGLAGVRLYKDFEKPFWTERLPDLTSGAVTAEIAPFDESGLKPRELLQLVGLGVTPFGTIIATMVAGEDPELMGLDLAGMTNDLDDLRRAAGAYRPILGELLRQRYGLELLGVYVYPAQVFFCTKPLGGLADLAGRRVRTASVTQSDFVEALGGRPVIIPFAQVSDAMRNGIADCVITGSLSGNQIGLHRTTSHNHRLPVSWGASIFVAHSESWMRIDPGVRAIVVREISDLEERIWSAAEGDTDLGFACNAGQAECRGGEPGRMTVVPSSPDDEATRRRVFVTATLPRWLERCGEECGRRWYSTIGRSLGLGAS